MKTRPGEKIKMLTVDQLLRVPEEESAIEISVDKIYAFENHPFKVVKDDKMQELIDSIIVNGIMQVEKSYVFLSMRRHCTPHKYILDAEYGELCYNMT